MRYFLDLFGCAKNQVDAETMAAYLGAAAWERVDEAAAADLIIVNSCGFIESAKKESIDEVLGLRAAYPDKKILLAGCLAQRYAVVFKDELLEADGFFGNARLSAVVEAAAAVVAGRRPCLVPLIPDVSADQSFCGSRPLFSLPGSAYVKITEGCDNRCSYCAIPLIRGGLRSRSLPNVLTEIQGLLERGIKEICLIGQDLGSYGRDLGGRVLLLDLLRAVSELEGRFWIRLLYIHPDHFPLGLLDVCRSDPRILPYFDLPFQHASTRLLHAMNRAGDAASYLGLIGEIRSALPDAVLRSTFLVGFPGETPDDFARLLEFQQRADLDWLGVFTFSREEDTAAFSLRGRVARKTASDRKSRIENAQEEISGRRMDRFVGRTVELLVEERVEGEDGLYLARAFCQAPEVDGSAVLSSSRPLELGAFVTARIKRRAGFDLDAVVDA